MASKAKSQLLRPLDEEAIRFRVALCQAAGRSLSVCQEQIARGWGESPKLRALVAEIYKQGEPAWPTSRR